MISNRQIAAVVDAVEAAIVRREHAASTRKDKGELIQLPWEEASPAYQERRTAAVHQFRMDGTIDEDAIDADVYASLVGALK